MQSAKSRKLGLLGFALLLITLLFLVTRSQNVVGDLKGKQMKEQLHLQNDGSPTISAEPGNAMNSRKAVRSDQDRIESTPQIHRPLFNSNGRLTSNSIDEIGLSELDAPKVQESIDRLFSGFEALMAKKATLNTAKSKPEQKIFIYDIPASGQESQILLDDFKSSLAFLKDPKKSELIYHMMCGGGADVEIFGGLGKYDARIEFRPSRAEGSTEQVVFFNYCDPKTGNQVMSSERSLEKFKEIYGDTFEFEK